MSHTSDSSTPHLEHAGAAITAGHDEDSGHEKAWDEVLTSAVPRDHIVQLYQDQEFLNRAVCRFAAAALANGEGLILVPTQAHWEAFCPRLHEAGVDTKAAQSRGQLTIIDADDCLPTFMRGATPSGPLFLGIAADIIARAR
ncbi:MAG: MEDS domain-containing protein, partial [Planctomycetota bacterium]